MSANIFSSLSGSYNYVNDMSSLIGDYSTIKSGAYGSLVKAYVKKVGNQNALNAYRETGSTTTAVESVTTKKATATTKKSNFVDSLGRAGADNTKKTDTSTVTADKYAKYKSSWLDDQLKQYDKDANKTTAADTSVALDTTI
ncbi:MAG: hypothetical protein K5792_06725 [Butyrivibrio sp.]|nr:hypothetical protein [Butyrivibrio sp.]